MAEQQPEVVCLSCNWTGLDSDLGRDSEIIDYADILCPSCWEPYLISADLPSPSDALAEAQKLIDNEPK